MPSTINCRIFLYCRIFLIHWGLNMIVKRKTGVREEVKERVKMILVTSTENKEGKGLYFDTILENEKIIFTTAIILSAAVNGRFMPKMS